MKFSNGCGAVAALLATVLSGCSGGGGDAGSAFLSSSGSTGGSCPTGVSACSGDVVGTAVGPIRLTSNGLQTIGASTSDLSATNTNTTEAFGLQPSTDGLADIRVLSDADANISAVDLLLSGLKLFWDGKTERPKIIENFGITRGRVQLGAQGMSTMTALPAQGDPFWDNNPTTFTGTQDHYANNHYYERPAPACADGDAPCIAAASHGLQLTRGDWKNGGARPNQIEADRLHEDGATQGPDKIPYAGFKGYRDLWNWNYDYANVAGWITKDTINIQEWGGGGEHNKERRGTIAFGQLTNVKAMPATGTAIYRGYARGWYSPDGQTEVFPVAADVEVDVDFAKHQATVQLLTLRIDEWLPANVDPAVKLAASSSNALPFGSPANTAIGTITHGDASGYAGLRFYGPTTTGAPPEIAGSFSLKGTSGISAIGGFIGRRVVQ
jgi:hypothetical protein